jgi:hypothetical protein
MIRMNLYLSIGGVSLGFGTGKIFIDWILY